MCVELTKIVFLLSISVLFAAKLYARVSDMHLCFPDIYVHQ